MATVEPLVSIVVPIYMAEQYIATCIESIQKQTYTMFELLLVIDGSPDKSFEICEQFAQKDNRISILTQDNRGVSAARNTGVKVARGEFITFVDADDTIKPNYIKRLLDACLDTGADVSVESSRLSSVTLYSGEEALKTMCYQKLFDTSPWGKLYSARIVKKNPFPEGMFFEDLACVCKFIADAEKVAVISGTDYCYYKNTQGTMSGKHTERVLDEIIAADMMYDFSSRFQSVKKAALSRKFSAYCQAYRKLPRGGYEEPKRKMIAFLLLVSHGVLKDNEARLKNRIAAFLIIAFHPLRANRQEAA